MIASARNGKARLSISIPNVHLVKGEIETHVNATRNYWPNSTNYQEKHTDRERGRGRGEREGEREKERVRNTCAVSHVTMIPGHVRLLCIRGVL
jgi:hypothetical protein